MASEPIPMIAGKLDRITDEIAALRVKALGASTIDPKTGAVRVAANSPELKRIASLEASQARLGAIKVEIGQLYQAAGVETREELHERRRNLEGDIMGAPIEAWRHFKHIHELPASSGGYPDLLPSELCQVERYRVLEDREKARRDQAKAALGPINEAIKMVSNLTAEANSL